jgi:hypothetical protein
MLTHVLCMCVRYSRVLTHSNCRSPHGRFLCIAGFGNLAGEMDFYDTLRGKKIGACMLFLLLLCCLQCICCGWLCLCCCVVCSVAKGSGVQQSYRAPSL